MIKVKLYGKLRKFVGQKEFDLDIKSPKEAFSFLIHNFDGLKQHMKEQEYCVMAGDIRITEDLLDLQTKNEIKIIPVVHGEFFFILAGIGALAGSAAIGATIFGSAILATVVSTTLSVVGVSLLSQGITELLTPTPTALTASGMDSQDPAALASFNFTGLTNVSKQGVPIPIVYGEVMVGSVIVSAGVDTFQISS